MTRQHHRPFAPGAAFFEARDSGVDAEQVREAADRAATLLVRGARASDDPDLTARILHLADNEGLETLAELWRGAPPESLAGILWRLYVLRTWVHADPAQAARDFESGRHLAEVAQVLAGVADPPGPDEVRAMIDDALSGISEGEFADVLFRAGAFARVVAAGRAADGDQPSEQTMGQVVRMLALAEQLERAGHEELAGRLA